MKKLKKKSIVVVLGLLVPTVFIGPLGGGKLPPVESQAIHHELNLG